MNGKKIIKYFLISIIILSIGFIFLYINKDSYKEYSFISPKAIDNFLSQSKSIDIIIAGDMMLDRNVRNIINLKGFDSYFDGIKNIINNADISVANLEGPFTDNPSITASLIDKSLQFTFDPRLVPKLYDLGFDVFGLANNHSMNFGKEGLDTTKEYLKQNNIKYYGDPNNYTDISTIIEKNGIVVGLVGFHEFTYINFDKVINEIKNIRNSVDVLIVSPHWGIEYQKEATDNMKKWAHEFIDAGADAVIGSHTHIIGDKENYKGKKIYYSLGNFAFDQYFSEETMNGLIVDMNIKKGYEGSISINYTDIPIKVGRLGIGQ